MEAILLDDITQAVREADEWFKKVGGSSRHWVDDCFMPMLKKQGLDIFKAQEVYDIEAAKAEADAEIARLEAKIARYKSNIDTTEAATGMCGIYAGLEHQIEVLKKENERIKRYERWFINIYGFVKGVLWESGKIEWDEKRALEDLQNMYDNKDRFEKALLKIKSWPDGGNDSGQNNIKKFVLEALSGGR